MLTMYEPACKHSQIARALIGEIRGGKYADAAFPSENALVRRFGVSRSTVRQPCADIARVAFDFLLSRIADPSLPPRECYLPAPLVVRESTAAPARRGNKTKGKPKK